MGWLERLSVGMPVRALDGRLGSVASIPRVDLDDPSAPAEVVVLATGPNAGPGVEEFRRVTRDMVERVGPDGLHLNLPRARVPRVSDAVAAAHRRLAQSDSRLRIPLLEEDVQVRTRVVERGRLVINKKVDERLHRETPTLRHDEVDVERVPVDRLLDAPLEPWMDGDVLVIPVIEEEVVVTTRLRLREELRVRRRVAAHAESIEVPLRSERLVVTEHWYADVSRQHSI